MGVLMWPIEAGLRVVHDTYGPGVVEPLTGHCNKGMQPVRFDATGKKLRVSVLRLQPEGLMTAVAMAAAPDDDPTDRCSTMGCQRPTYGQVLFRTSRGNPPGHDGIHNRYVLSHRMCEPCCTSYADSAGNKGYEHVEVMEL